MSKASIQQDPAQLYQYYREHRLVDAEFDALFQAHATAGAHIESTGATSSMASNNHESEMQQDDAVTELYQLYRRQHSESVTDHADAIDGIMQQLTIDEARQRLLSSHFSADTAQQTGQETVSAPGTDESKQAEPNARGSQSALKNLFTLPGKLFDAAVQAISAPKSRVLVPALALGLLAVFVAPRMMHNTNTFDQDTIEVASLSGVPASLLEVAADTPTNLGESVTAMAGFTSGRSLPSARFVLGGAVTHLALKSAGARIDNPQALAATLRGSAELENASHIRKARETIAVLAESGDPVDVVAGLRTFDRALLTTPSDPALYQWYRAGQVVESVYLSADYALASDDLQPFADSLNVLQALEPMPADAAIEPFYRKMQELRQLASTSTLSMVDARRARELAHSIRVLMMQ